MDLNHILATIGDSLAGSSFESEWNTMSQNPDFLNLLTATREIIQSMATLYPRTLTTESEKQALRDSIHNAVVNNAAFQTEIGLILQPGYEPLIFTIIEKCQEGAKPHEFSQVMLEIVQNEMPASEQGVLTNAINDVLTSLPNTNPT